MTALLQSNFKYYRIAYSLFALITLVAVIAYNISIPKIFIWNVTNAEKIIALVCMIIFAAIMLLFIKRFFFDLSGADVFKKNKVSRELIKTNLYRFVRHPLYSATLGFIWSIFFYQPLVSNLVSCICITIYTIAGIYIEEKKLVLEFGETYVHYRSKTPMLFPRLF